MGLSASDRAIGAVIAGVQAFQLGGKFDECDLSRRARRSSACPTRNCATGIHDDLVRRQLLTPVTASLGVPGEHGDALCPAARRYPPRRRRAGADDAGRRRRPPPRWTNSTRPTRPPSRCRSAAPSAMPSSIPTRSTAGVKVSDAQIAAAFAKDAAKYGAAATRKLQQVVVADEAAAKAIVAAAASEGFAAAAQRLGGFGAADIALGDQTQADFAKATSPAVASAAFTAPVGGVTQPIKTDFGWHVVKVEATGAGKTLAAGQGQGGGRSARRRRPHRGRRSRRPHRRRGGSRQELRRCRPRQWPDHRHPGRRHRRWRRRPGAGASSPPRPSATNPAMAPRSKISPPPGTAGSS